MLLFLTAVNYNMSAWMFWWVPNIIIIMTDTLFFQVLLFHCVPFNNSATWKSNSMVILCPPFACQFICIKCLPPPPVYQNHHHHTGIHNLEISCYVTRYYYYYGGFQATSFILTLLITDTGQYNILWGHNITITVTSL